MNLYGMVGNNPVNWTDYLGREPTIGRAPTILPPVDITIGDAVIIAGGWPEKEPDPIPNPPEFNPDDFGGEDNCHSYACNRPGGDTSPGGSPGRKGTGRPPENCAEMKKKMMDAGAKKVNDDGSCPYCYHKVSMHINLSRRGYHPTGGDGHYMRQDADGTWSHKTGFNAKPVNTWTDSKGNKHPIGTNNRGAAGLLGYREHCPEDVCVKN